MRKYWKRNYTIMVIMAVVVVVVALFLAQKEEVLAAPQTLIASFPTYLEVRRALQEIVAEDNGGLALICGRPSLTEMESSNSLPPRVTGRVTSGPAVV